MMTVAHTPCLCQIMKKEFGYTFIITLPPIELNTDISLRTMLSQES